MGDSRGAARQHRLVVHWRLHARRRRPLTRLGVVIGLEVHAQLTTRTKLFCGCPVAFGGEPNTRVCPVCLGLPGALPVANREALRLAVRLSQAVGAKVHHVSQWARKNYFYPDLPKGYQISQYQRPLSSSGYLRVEPEGEPPRTIGIDRIHLEEDAGKSMHGSLGDETVSGIDFNRCGVALVEIVSAPVLRTPQEAYLYLERLRAVLRATGVSEADMQTGSLRCDANVSVHREGEPWGRRVEVKNVNSFRFVRRALAFEIDRQRATVARGGEVEHESRLWDEQRCETRPMRGKEELHDYRYFPEPDLPALVVSETLMAEAAHELPELPHARRDRLVRDSGLSVPDAHRLSSEPDLAEYFEQVVRVSRRPREAASWVLTELLGELNRRGLGIDQSPVSGEQLGELIQLVAANTISGKIAKRALALACETGRSPAEIVEQHGWRQISDQRLIEHICREIVEAHPEQVMAYRRGKSGLLGYFVSRVMARTSGQANPALVSQMLTRLLEGCSGGTGRE
ncbi:MAG: Asp-tRNA(Asn)/Glu-tRNA(Gln) amidotransferase subunit GatB [Acidobacteriota bacterium]|nr:MAG: Asp-tRNA(Asn)/Glu-tRNA(Gln) amidotransferase subunit GatB [Acidobacteriota bacterium]